MATLEDILAAAPQQIKNITNQLLQITDVKDDLEETKTELEDRIMTPAKDAMDIWTAAKLQYYIDNNPDPVHIKYQLDTGTGYGVSTISSWKIQESDWVTPLPPAPPGWGPWYDIYTFEDAVSDGVVVVIDSAQEFDYGYDYINQDPSDLDGSYGLQKKIDAINSANTVLTGNRNQQQSSVEIITRVIT